MLKLNPIWQPEIQQSHYRLLLDAMAHPGRRYSVTTQREESPMALAILATLLDAEVSLADPHGLLQNEDWFMLQAKSLEANQADYILCDGSLLPGFEPKLGTLPSPDQSATLVLVVDKIGQGNINLKLEGPGIAETEKLTINGIDVHWFSKREDWVCSFPLGVDFIFVDDIQIVAIPRTTKVELI